MRGNSTISNRCRCHRTAAVDHRTSCRWRPPYAIMEAPDVDARELIKQVLRVGTNLNHLVFLAQCQNFIDVPELRKMANAIWECHRAMMKAYTPPSVRKEIWKEED